MLRKKETLTIITPIPGFIPRQLAIDILHSHSEVITLNPLVLSHKAIPAPRNAAADEYYSTWYEITERIQYVPGMGRAGSGKITFNGCFHDMPWGLQTHIYAPMNVDMRNRYRIQGNQPGIEPPEHPELGLEELGAPKDGLYLREDIELKCNIAVMGFVKAETKKASKEMINRMVKKAELLDAGILKAMFENGKLKTYNPADRSNTMSQNLMPQPPVQGQSLSYQGSPSLTSADIHHSPYSRPNTGSSQGDYSQQNPYNLQQQTSPPQAQHAPPQAQHAPPIPPKTPSGQHFAMELPGDYYYQPPRSPNAQQQPLGAPHFYESKVPTQPPDPRWSQSMSSPTMSDHRVSMGSVSSGGMKSPGMGHPGFAAELPAHAETREEYRR